MKIIDKIKRKYFHFFKRLKATIKKYMVKEICKEMGQDFFISNKDAWINALNTTKIFDKELEVLTLKNGIILPLRRKENTRTNLGGVCDENFNFISGFARRNYDKKSNPWGEVMDGYIVDNNELEYVDETVVFGGVLLSQFGYMIIDNLSRLWYHVENKNIDSKFVFIMAEGTYRPWMDAFFELLELPKDRIVILDKPTQFKEVIVPEESVYSYLGYSPKYLLPHEAMVQKGRELYGNLDNAPKKIFLTRSQFKGGGTYTLNEEYFEDFYRARGYEVIAPDKVPLWKMVALMSNAEKVAATNSSVCFYFMFMNKNAHLDLIIRMHDIVDRIHTTGLSAKGINFCIIDASMNFLPSHPGTGVHFVATTHDWKQYVEKYWNKWDNKDDTPPEMYYKYINMYLNNFNTTVFNRFGICNMSAFDIINRMSTHLLGKSLDPKEYNATSTVELKKQLEAKDKEIAQLKQSLETIKSKLSAIVDGSED